MPEVQIRPAIGDDIPILISKDHSYTTDYVWQMDIHQQEGQVGATFREIRLPRTVRSEYPQDLERLGGDWSQRALVLVAESDGQPLGYISLDRGLVPGAVWVTDWMVDKPNRGQGIGTVLLMEAQHWAASNGFMFMYLAVQSKNYAVISLAQKNGYDFCGYSDQYYPNQDIALFFVRRIGMS